MKITEVKINGIRNPLGFSFPVIKCSWKVEDTLSKKQTNAKIVVSRSASMEPVLYEKQGSDLSCTGTKLEIETEPCTRYFVQVSVQGDAGDSAVSEQAWFETGKMDQPWEAEFIGMEKEDTFHPEFRKAFSLSGKVSSARIYVTGLGLYEAYLNGKKIGDDYLAPFCNDYRKHVQYQTYDITDMLGEENEIRILTGNGWFKGRLGYDGDVSYYGNRFGVIAELHICYADGSSEIIPTDSTWEYRGSDIADSDIYDGEIVDHLLWNGKENPWQPAVILGGDSKSLLGNYHFDYSGERSHQPYPFDKTRLKERYSLPVVVKESIKVKEVIHTPAGETVLDMGQNFAGYMTFYAQLPAGTKVVLDYGEILQNGNFYNDNYRTAKARFVYISDGRGEQVRPHFTYYGFRYARVKGWPGELDPELFSGQVVYSDLDTTIALETSNENLNQLASNTLWGQKSNFLDMPTDCPQRDERLGWTGDAQVFSPTASFQMDTRAFYRKFLYDLRLDQEDHDGVIPNFIPNISNIQGGSSVWGDVATFLPATLYQYYGDADELARFYPMMKDWVDYIIREDKKYGEKDLWLTGMQFGDWLALDGVTENSIKGATDDGFLASVYYYASVKKVSEAAKIIGKLEDAEFYQEKAAKIYAAVLREYFSQSGRLAVDTQTAYFLALKFHVYLDREKVIEGLKLRLKRDCYKIKGGFVGAPMMCQVLAENGMEDIAYYILLQEDYPGWMHCVKLGATTIWERWNSVLDDGSINGTGMNSLNHYSYGAVMEFVYRSIAGINETEAGFKKVRFVPHINGMLKHVYCSYDSASGRYVSEWTLQEDGSVKIHFEVPFNCTAVAVLPGTKGREIQLMAGVYEETYMPAVDLRQRYTMNSRLQEMKDDPEALKILAEELPIAVGMIEGQDIENMCMSLEELKQMAFMGVDPVGVQKAAERLQELKY